MALRLVRQTSDTPNVTNKDDVRMVRYAYGGYNGIVKAFGSECEYTAENGIFKVLDGRICVDGWEIDVDGAGWLLNLSTITGTQYHSVYAEINVATESIKLDSTYLQGTYPEITKGDDLTEIPNGTARLLLYNVRVENGSITQVVKKFEIIPYLTQKVLDLEESLTKNVSEIDERLKKLGFKSGVIKFAGVNYGSEEYTDTKQNGIYRQGNYVFCNIIINRSLSALERSNYLRVGSANLPLEIPVNFRPKTDTKVLISAVQSSNVCEQYEITIKPNGTSETTDYWIFGDQVATLKANIVINFGYETPPITN